MALLARTFRTVVGLPWSTLALLDRAMRWSAEPELLLEAATSEIWAEDLFAPCSTKCCLSYSNDDVTDSSGSEMCDEEDEDEWTCSESEEELDGFSFAADGDVDFWGDRWFWIPCQDDEDFAAHSCSDLIDMKDAEQVTYVAERLVDYAMPTMDPNTDAAVDSWIDKYGSSRSQVRFVTMTIGSSSTGLFVTVL
ncbi:hypothetical protein PHYSODRAFT_478286 [Phytophthora sojae]|uniref:Uncharacterized protein n=1 Tax=Phytophthora sojae (strain P6497) TaxID=1094619 RepID=G4Z1B3_PHYSP|nr:hypothetical protein PHYSODRAFT_478286 [Phytophthora sojae]EGZ24732.1 hypothetical protein PHYSODRAFT_478286 [Phytophthora sojae]|eukprot:XP_009520020.1 hypothetical protein PHYSODRAFT_478286 [Phytophthora sojae]